MLVGPLIARELREQSRWALTYWLRVVGVATVLVVTLQVLAGTGRASWGWRAGPDGATDWLGSLEAGVAAYEGRGGALFHLLNLLLLGGIWFLAPMLTADGLSRERREGTLGLLFLTPLRPGHIVAAKLGANLLRGGSVLLAVLPVLAVTMLLGGVSWDRVVRAAWMDAGALILALSVGLLASVLWQGQRMVLFGAVALSFLAAGAWGLGWTTVEVLVGGAGGAAGNLPGAVWLAFLRRARRVMAMIQVLVGEYAGGPWVQPSVSGAGRVPSLLGGVGMLGLAVSMALVVFAVARAHVARCRHEGRAPGRGQAAVAWLERPRFFAAVSSRLRSMTLAWEPVLWTEFRTWRLRIGTWIMPLALLPALVNWVSVGAYGHAERYELPAWILMSLLALAAASCLGVERGSGVLELLLTTPRGIAGVMRGKLVALAVRALPCALLLVATAAAMFVGAGLSSLQEGSPWNCLAGLVLSLAARLLLVAAAGMFFSMRLQGYLPALFATLGTVVGCEGLRMAWMTTLEADHVLGMGTRQLVWYQSRGWVAGWNLAALAQMALSGLFLWRLACHLRRR